VPTIRSSSRFVRWHLLTRLGEALAASRAQGRRESASQACHAAALASYAMCFGHQCE
jgi:hypothetical protein